MPILRKRIAISDGRGEGMMDGGQEHQLSDTFFFSPSGPHLPFFPIVALLYVRLSLFCMQ